MLDWTCILAAVLFLTADILGVVFYFARHNQGHFDYQTFKNLDPEYLQTNWEWKINYRPLELAFGIINALAWFFFAIPILKVAWVQSAAYKHRKQVGIHIAVAALALGGSISELLSRLIYIGSSAALEWMANDFNLDNWTGETSNDGTGWRTLEMIAIASGGMLLWIDAIEFLFLFGIMTFLFLSVRKSEVKLFSMRWAWLGALIAVLSILDFAVAILRFQNWNTFGKFEFFLSVVNRFLLFPAWLLWLARQLSKAEVFQGEEEERKANDDLELTENTAADVSSTDLQNIPFT